MKAGLRSTWKLPVDGPFNGGSVEGAPSGVLLMAVAVSAMMLQPPAGEVLASPPGRELQIHAAGISSDIDTWGKIGEHFAWEMVVVLWILRRFCAATTSLWREQTTSPIRR